MKIFWTPLAFERLEEIFEYISRDDLKEAQKMVERIFAKVETLSEFPERGRIVPEANRKEIREVFESEYRIIYRFDSDKLYILSLRNFREMLKDKDLK